MCVRHLRVSESSGANPIEANLVGLAATTYRLFNFQAAAQSKFNINFQGVAASGCGGFLATTKDEETTRWGGGHMSTKKVPPEKLAIREMFKINPSCTEL